MPSEKSCFASGTRIIGQVTTDGDLLVEGHLEGGPLRVSGCLTVSANATVQCADAEVGDALVIGLFQGTLRARDVVRIHQSGRVVGDILASRVMFVSEPPPAPRPPPAAATTAATAAVPAASQSSLAMPHAEPPHAPPAPPATAAAVAPETAAARPASRPPVSAPRTAPASRPPAPIPPASVSAPPPPAKPAGPRSIPALPSIGQRAMERKD